MEKNIIKAILRESLNVTEGEDKKFYGTRKK